MMESDDVILLKTVVRCYGYIGNFSNSKRIRLIILIPFHFIGIVCFTYLYGSYLKLINVSFIGLIIYKSYLIIIVLYDASYLKGVFTQETLWSSFFSDVEAFDVLIGEKTIFLKTAIYKYYSLFILSNVSFITGHLLMCSLAKNYIDFYQLVIAFIYSDLALLHIIGTTLVLQKIFQLLIKRHTLLETKIREAFTPTSRGIENWNVQNLELLYSLLDSMIKKINKVFGQKILALILAAFLYILGCFQFILLEDSQEKFKDIVTVTGSGVLMVLFLVSSWKKFQNYLK